MDTIQNFNEMSMAYHKIFFKYEELKKYVVKLTIANKKLVVCHKEEKRKETALDIANKELFFQNTEKEMRASELVIANEKLLFENKEKEMRASELVIANKKLLFENKEKEKRASELIIANKKLLFENSEKSKRACELALLVEELNQSKEQQKEYIQVLETMMFIVSHKIRRPVANIMGLSTLLKENEAITDDDFNKILIHITQSAELLEEFTHELTWFIHEKRIVTVGTVN